MPMAGTAGRSSTLFTDDEFRFRILASTARTAAMTRYRMLPPINDEIIIFLVSGKNSTPSDMVHTNPTITSTAAMIPNCAHAFRGPNRTIGTSAAAMITPSSHHHPKCPVPAAAAVKHSPPSTQKNAIFHAYTDISSPSLRFERCYASASRRVPRITGAVTLFVREAGD